MYIAVRHTINDITSAVSSAIALITDNTTYIILTSDKCVVDTVYNVRCAVSTLCIQCLERLQSTYDTTCMVTTR